MSTKKNYYVCLRLAQRPELHLTLNYQKNLTPGQMAELITKVNSILSGCDMSQFVTLFDIEAWYGPYNTVRALEPRDHSAWPGWVDKLVNIEGRDTKYKWSPHIVCQDKSFFI